MISHIEPVPYIETIPVDREGFSFKGIEDHKGDEFFRELIGAVVVGAVGDGYGEAVRLVVSPHQMI